MYSVARQTIYGVCQDTIKSSYEEAIEVCKEWSKEYPNCDIVIYEVDLDKGYTQVYAMRNKKVVFTMNK